MSTVKSIFSSLGRFLEKARAIMLNLATAFVLIFFLIIIIGGLTSGPEVKDPSGGVLLINPEGVVVDQEVFTSNFPFDLTAGSPTCLLYTSPSPRDNTTSRMPSSA